LHNIIVLIRAIQV